LKPREIEPQNSGQHFQRFLTCELTMLGGLEPKTTSQQKSRQLLLRKGGSLAGGLKVEQFGFVLPKLGRWVCPAKVRH
jgi:hypothetical protein